MADDGERRMLFDTRGRRRNVIRVVYATLALLMGTSLFFVVGPVNIGEIVGNSASTEASELFEERAERLEERLRAEPGKEQQLLAELTRTRINAGNSLVEVEPGEVTQEVTPEAEDQYEKAEEAWDRYLEAVDGQPDAGVASLVAVTFFRLAESPSNVRAIEENVARAAEAQRIAAEQRPSVGSFTTLAYYEYFNGNFEAGERAKRRAIAQSRSKAETESIEGQLAEFRKSAKEFDRQRKQLSQAEKEAPPSEGGNPFALPGGLAE